jgi:hypothetical protein
VAELRKSGVEVYLVCLGFDPKATPHLTAACTGAIGCQDPSEITTRVPRELAAVLLKGALP